MNGSITVVSVLSAHMHQVPARERLLEGFLRRLAIARDADAYALRGGWMVRTWVPDAGRHVRDVDLVCRLPATDLRGRLHEILATPDADGVVFESERFRISRAWPAQVLFARGRVDGVLAEIVVDLMFELEVWPQAKRQPLTTARGSAELWTCPHEMVIATKLALLASGPRAWRPKDLGDVWWLLRRFAGEPRAKLGEAIERAGGPALASPWWNERAVIDRWACFALRQPALPFELDAVLAEVRDQLRPFARN